MPMRWSTIDIPLAQGLDTKSAEQVLAIGKLLVAENVRFVEPGNLQKRRGFANKAMQVHGLSAGNNVANTKALGQRKGETFLCADDKVYSWLPDASEWSDRGAYQPVQVETNPVADSPQEQRYASRAELSGVVLYAWEDPKDASSNGTEVKYVLVDSADRSQFVGVQGTFGKNGVGSNNTERPICLATSNRLVLLFMVPGTGKLFAHHIDPGDVAGTVGNTAIEVTGASPGDLRTTATRAFDACTETGAEYFVVFNNTDNTNTRYSAVKMNATAIVDTVNVARASDDVLTCSYGSTSDTLFVGRRATNNIKGDFLDNTSSLADSGVVDVTIASKAAGDTMVAVASERHPTAVGSEDRIYLWHSRLVAATGGFVTTAYLTAYSTLDSDGGTSGGSMSPFAWHSRIASKPLIQGTDLFIHLVNMTNPMAGGTDVDVQRSVFLMKDDQRTIARILPGLAGGETTEVSRTIPNVQTVSGKHYWVPVFRQRLTVSDPENNQFGNRAIKEITYDFASHIPFQSVEQGECAYMPGGYQAMYDGEGVVETNFNLFPSDFALAESAATGGLVTGKSYSYRVYFEWTNAQGEIERSTNEGAATFAVTSTNDTITLSIPSLPFTVKDPLFGRESISVVVFRTKADPGPGALFYRITSPDPTVSTVDATTAAYARNGGGVATGTGIDIVDKVSDANLGTHELDRFNGGELDNIPVEPGDIMKSGQNRLFLTGVENGNVIRYSKLRFQGVAVAFNDTLMIEVPQDGGKITALAVLDQHLLVFKRSRLYLISGVGPDNLGQGNYSIPQLISSDTGCDQARSVVEMPNGVMFKGPKGIYMMDRGFVLQYVGAPVEDLDGLTFTGGLLSDDSHQVIMQGSATRTLVYDYHVKQWSTWTISGDSLILTDQGELRRLDTDIMSEQGAIFQDNSLGYAMVAETGWIRPGGIAGFARLRRIILAGRNHGGTHDVRVRIYFDDNDTAVDDFTITPDSQEYVERFRTSIQKIRSFKVRVEELKNGATELNDSAEWIGFGIEVGLKGGLQRLPAARTQ